MTAAAAVDLRHAGPPATGPFPRSDPLEDGGDALPAADAHGDERVPAAGPAQLVQGLDGEDGAGGADQVAEGDPAAAEVDPVRRQAELPSHGARLRCERLVHLAQVD